MSELAGCGLNTYFCGVRLYDVLLRSRTTTQGSTIDSLHDIHRMPIGVLFSETLCCVDWKGTSKVWNIKNMLKNAPDEQDPTPWSAVQMDECQADIFRCQQSDYAGKHKQIETFAWWFVTTLLEGVIGSEPFVRRIATTFCYFSGQDFTVLYCTRNTVLKFWKTGETYALTLIPIVSEWGATLTERLVYCSH